MELLIDETQRELADRVFADPVGYLSELGIDSVLIEAATGELRDAA